MYGRVERVAGNHSLKNMSVLFYQVGCANSFSAGAQISFFAIRLFKLLDVMEIYMNTLQAYREVKHCRE